MPTVVIGGQSVTLDPKTSVGQGGEADVYRTSPDRVAKIFKTARHPDFKGDADAQKGATARIAEHQDKLPAFPKGLPDSVTSPLDLVHDTRGKIAGYTMRFLDGCEVLLKLGERGYRTQNQITHPQMVEVFQGLHRTVADLHRNGVVIGDFNDLNVLVQVGAKGHNRGYLIDADSMQYGSFPCRVFTAGFVDPLICRPDELVQDRPHSDATDWYAFAILLMKTMLFVTPYGGVFVPKDKARRVPHAKRPLYRLTVFDPEVQYPKAGIPYASLPDDLLHHLTAVFVNNHREPFPRHLIDMEWQDCRDCGTPHARRVCPVCGQKGLGQVVETTVIRGTVTASRIFTTPGTILAAAMQAGRLRWLWHENGAFHRDGNFKVMDGKPDRFFRYRLSGETTLFGQGSTCVTLRPNATPEVKAVDAYGKLAMIDATATKRYWIENGHLVRDGKLTGYPEEIGPVLGGQTFFWVGEQHGFGFYRAGELFRAFVFRSLGQGLAECPDLPRLLGTLIDSTVVFGQDRIFFLTKTSEGSRTVNRCTVLDPQGRVVAQAEADDGQPGWLGTIRGKTAAGANLLCPTDAGIVRVEVAGQTLVVTREFPDSEPFVDQQVDLQAGPDGLYVIRAKEILKLQIR